MSRQSRDGRFARAGGRDGSDVAVIGAGVWRRRFRADPGVVGARMLLEGKPYTLRLDMRHLSRLLCDRCRATIVGRVATPA